MFIKILGDKETIDEFKKFLEAKEKRYEVIGHDKDGATFQVTISGEADCFHLGSQWGFWINRGNESTN